MKTEYFVPENSAVRAVWGHSDRALMVFAGAAAEFALNKAVDWLYFTGKLPEDPLARLFSTISYAQKILFAEKQDAINAIKMVNKIHKSVENNRGLNIPDWAFRDVLYMLIDYTIKAFELSHGSITINQKEEVFDTFILLGKHMEIEKLPIDYPNWEIDREKHLRENLAFTEFTKDLFTKYRKHLGKFRFWILVEGQKELLPDHVKTLLNLNGVSRIGTLLKMYPHFNNRLIMNKLPLLLIPEKYHGEIRTMNALKNSYE
jgi:ER-bound oxygenase mpaB/B'/Rubber oxygenase, catalytic domain